MKYKLKDGFPPRMVTLGNHTYLLNSKDFREYPDTILNMYKNELVPEKQPKPQKETELEVINNGE